MGIPQTVPNRLILTVEKTASFLLAGRSYWPLWGLLRHRGRATGHEYRIPVVVLATPDEIVIPLLYGSATNWVRNVRSAGGCRLYWRGEHHELADPELIGLAESLPYFSPLKWRFSEFLVRPSEFLRLRRVA